MLAKGAGKSGACGKVVIGALLRGSSRCARRATQSPRISAGERESWCDNILNPRPLLSEDCRQRILWFLRIYLLLASMDMLLSPSECRHDQEAHCRDQSTSGNECARLHRTTNNFQTLPRGREHCRNRNTCDSKKWELESIIRACA
jgi:hypothetical protein